jgi:hypothetical protein
LIIDSVLLVASVWLAEPLMAPVWRFISAQDKKPSVLTLTARGASRGPLPVMTAFDALQPAVMASAMTAAMMEARRACLLTMNNPSTPGIHT